MADRQTVLVTGGASGIGHATAEAMLAEGWRVAVADRDRRGLDRAREAWRGRGETRFDELDVSDEEAVIRCIAGIEAEFGALTGVVNSAGIAQAVPALETSAELFRKILNVNLIGSFLVSREAAKAMRKRGSGAIVNIASVSGLIGNEGRMAYGASKGGVITMTKVMAIELALYGIRVNAIAPGAIDTPLVRDVHTPEARTAWTSATPQRRYGRPDEIAAAALFLLDPGKSGFITGQTICADGGFMAAGMRTRATMGGEGEA
jgi:NAD(P)-dependent dehydrogenase (short-subunit alcohol dehydrogenase family)